MKVLRNQLVLPLNFEILIDENDPVWKLTEICDGLDYTRLYNEYLRHWRICKNHIHLNGRSRQ